MSIGFLLPPDRPVIWRGPMIAGTLKQFLYDVAWGELDYLVVDLPPGTGDAPLTLVQSIPITGAVLVTTPAGRGPGGRDQGGLDVHDAVGERARRGREHELLPLPALRRAHRGLRPRRRRAWPRSWGCPSWARSRSIPSSASAAARDPPDGLGAGIAPGPGLQQRRRGGCRSRQRGRLRRRRGAALQARPRLPADHLQAQLIGPGAAARPSGSAPPLSSATRLAPNRKPWRWPPAGSTSSVSTPTTPAGSACPRRSTATWRSPPPRPIRSRLSARTRPAPSPPDQDLRPTGSWADHPLGVLAELARDGVPVSGAAGDRLRHPRRAPASAAPPPSAWLPLSPSCSWSAPASTVTR